MNTYTYKFASECPRNGESIIYTVSITHKDQIFVEHIKTACSMHKRAYHEHIAQILHQQFGGTLKLVANHHGVDIETVLA